jgi:DNA replication protein DnaC
MELGEALLAPMVQDLYDIICERYERGSIIITSNRAFEEWSDVFGNELLASAALDRLTHHAYTVVVRGQSYRQRSRRKEVAGATPALPAEDPPKSF